MTIAWVAAFLVGDGAHIVGIIPYGLYNLAAPIRRIIVTECGTTLAKGQDQTGQISTRLAAKSSKASMKASVFATILRTSP